MKNKSRGIIEFNRNIVCKNKYKILIILLLVFLLPTASPTSLSKPDTENPQLTLISKEILQNKGETSYFLVLEPDNLGNLRIKVDVIDYNQNLSRIFSIVQKNPKFAKSGNNTIYQEYYPKLAYILYSDKIFSMSSNRDVSYNFTENVNFNYTPESGPIEPRIQTQKINLLLPNEIKKKNITDFGLLIFANDSNSESHLERYPFDYIDTIILFDFPNNTNVNIMVEIPKELNSYKINSNVFDENKITGEKNPNPLKEIYSGIHAISSTNKVNFENNYARIEINVNRAPFSFEKFSFYGIILLTIFIFIYYIGQKYKINLIELISLYIGLISIPLAIYLNNRPSLSGLTIYEPYYIIVVVVLGLILWKKNKNKVEYYSCIFKYVNHFHK